MATAQVEAWVGAHRGSILEVARGIDVSFADAALGRMMLHRRRAVVASVITEFFAHVGRRFAPYLESRASWAPRDPGDEMAIATKAGDLVGNICGESPPLLFERALLAEADGQLGEAQADLKQVLAAYPGFVAGAIAAGRVALRAADPGEAIRSLASVEREITHTREGAALLADALRALGLYEAASRYDLAALTCRGGYESRGNDCAPIDLVGKVADDERMPQILYFEGQVDGGIVCNSRGIYYRVSPLFGRLLAEFNGGREISTMRSLGPGKTNSQSRRLTEIFEAATTRSQLVLADRFPGAAGLTWNYLSAARQFLTAAFRLVASIAIALAITLYRMYRRLPVPVRTWANRFVQFQMRIVQSQMRLLLRFLLSLSPTSIVHRLGPRGNWRTFSQISEPNARRQLAEARYQSGVARIFGLRPFHQDVDAEASAVGHSRLAMRLLRSADGTAGSQARPAAAKDAAATSNAGGLQMPPAGKFPPLAERILRSMVSETGFRRPA